MYKKKEFIKSSNHYMIVLYLMGAKNDNSLRDDGFLSPRGISTLSRQKKRGLHS